MTTTSHEVISKFIHDFQKIFNQLFEQIREAFLVIQESITDLQEDLEKFQIREQELETSRKIPTPARMDTRHVTTLNTKPPAPTHIYRRRTP